MPVSLARRGVWAVVAVVVLIILVVAGLPLVASTQIVRDRIAYQMSAWTGYRVRLDEAPRIRIWPSFEAVLDDVTLLDWNETEPHAVLDAERIEVNLSALAALRGEVVFTAMRFIRPVVRLREEGGRLSMPTPQQWGRLARSIDTAKQAVMTAPNSPDTRVLPNDSFGVVEFVDGRITAGSGETRNDIVTSLTGTLDWPSLNRQATLSAKGIWHGESISVSASSAQPLILLGGGAAPVTLSLQAAPANASFKGTASLTGDNFVDGQLSVAAPSLNRLIEWTRANLPIAGRIGPVSVTSRLVGDMRRIKFENTTLDLDSSTGKGVVDMNFDNGRPLIAGTLAFDTLNLGALINAFSPLDAAIPSGRGTPVKMKGGGIDFDLRFSAVNATYGKAALTNVAAAIKVRDGLVTFDVSDATAFGGRMQFGMRADQAATSVEISMMGEQIDADKLPAGVGYKALTPQAKANFTLMLKGKGRDFETVLQTADGSFSASCGKGTVTGLNLDAFLKSSEEGGFFPLVAFEEGSLPIEGAEVKASIVKGIAQIDEAEARSGPYLLALDGLVPFAGRGLALYGSLTAPKGTDPRLEAPLTFFVGGSWSTPFVAAFSAKGE